MEISKPLEVVNLSHTSMDGYAASFLIKSYYDEVDQPVKFTAINADYSYLQEKIKTLHNFHEKQIDVLIVTDLNLNLQSIELLSSLGSKFKTLVFLGEFNTNINYSEEFNKRLKPRGVDVITFSTPLSSASKTVYEFFKPSKDKFEAYSLYKYKTIISFIDAWDIHNLSKPIMFGRGQLFNDFFGELMGMFKHIKRKYKDILIYEFFKYANNNLYTSQDISLGTIDSTIRNRIPSVFMDVFWDDPVRKEMTAKVSTQVSVLGFKQAMSLIVAYIISLDPFFSQVVTLDNGDEVRVFVPGNDGLPMGIVHHLLYTLAYTDIVIVHSSDGKVEMRQSADRALVSLSDVAAQYGGGGRVSSAGFYTKTFDVEKIISSIKVSYLKT